MIRVFSIAALLTVGQAALADVTCSVAQLSPARPTAKSITQQSEMPPETVTFSSGTESVKADLSLFDMSFALPPDENWNRVFSCTGDKMLFCVASIGEPDSEWGKVDYGLSFYGNVFNLIGEYPGGKSNSLVYQILSCDGEP